MYALIGRQLRLVESMYIKHSCDVLDLRVLLKIVL